MKTRSKFFSKAISCVLMAALTLVICFPVAAATNSTTLTTTVPETLPFFLELSGNGTVMINGVAYTQSCAIQIPRNSTIEFLITPDAENEIKSIIYNGFDYTKEAKNGKLNLPAITGEAMLHIHFAEITSAPVTRDSHSPQFFVLVMLLSLIGIIVTSSFIKKKEN